MSKDAEQDKVQTGEFTEDEMASLSDEERAALADDDSEVKDPEAEAEPAAAEAEGDDPKPANKPDVPDKDASQDAEPEGDKTPEEADKPGDDDQKKPEEKAVEHELPADQLKAVKPNREVGDLEKLNTELSQVSTGLKDLATQLADGEIELAEYALKTQELQDKKVDLAIAKNNFERNQSENQIDVEAQWDSAVSNFYNSPDNKMFDAAENGGNDVIYNALNGTVQSLQQAQPDRSPAWYLAEGKRLVQEAFSMPVSGKAQEPEPEKDKPQRRKSALDADIPKTLADLPAAANNSVDEFSSLDSLGGEELELAVSKMSKSQQDKWAASQ